jgi:hypothetical protein
VAELKSMKARLLGGLELWRLQLRPPIEAAPAGFPVRPPGACPRTAGTWRPPTTPPRSAALRLARELLRASSETLTEAAELAIQSGLPDDEEVALCDILSTAARHVSKTAQMSASRCYLPGVSGVLPLFSLAAQGLVPAAVVVVLFIRNSRGLSHHCDSNCSQRAVVGRLQGCLLPDLLLPAA